MRPTCFLIFALVLRSVTALGNEVIFPPLNNETLVGVWEGFLEGPPGPLTLLRMEINAKGDSYLAQTSVQPWPRTPQCIVYKLVGSDSKIEPSEAKASNFMSHRVMLTMTGTPIALHFHQVSSGPGIHDIWIKGFGVATPAQGSIRCTSFGEDVWLEKESWTRDLARASEAAEKEIKKELSKPTALERNDGKH